MGSSVKRASNAESLIAAQTMMETISKDLRATASRLAAEQARVQLTEAQAQYKNRLKAENKGMRDWEVTMVRENGYSVSGNSISRQMIVDSTVFSNVKKTQSVYMYKDFLTADAKITVDLEAAALEGIDDYGIMLLVAQAQRDMQQWSEGIFGRMEGGAQRLQTLTVAGHARERAANNRILCRQCGSF